MWMLVKGGVDPYGPDSAMGIAVRVYVPVQSGASVTNTWKNPSGVCPGLMVGQLGVIMIPEAAVNCVSVLPIFVIADCMEASPLPGPPLYCGGARMGIRVAAISPFPAPPLNCAGASGGGRVAVKSPFPAPPLNCAGASGGGRVAVKSPFPAPPLNCAGENGGGRLAA